MIYHLAKEKHWRDASARGESYKGGDQDRRDGFIHLSTRNQIVESAARHRTGELDLMLLAVEDSALGSTLRWETSRSGDLFPHCYGSIPLSAVVWTARLPPAPDNRHVFPNLLD